MYSGAAMTNAEERPIIIFCQQENQQTILTEDLALSWGVLQLNHLPCLRVVHQPFGNAALFKAWSRGDHFNFWMIAVNLEGTSKVPGPTYTILCIAEESEAQRNVHRGTKLINI